MKTSITTILLTTILFLSSCKEKTEDSKSNSTTSEILKTEKKAIEKSSDNTLQQLGDYTSLFNNTSKDCNFITSETLTQAIGVNENKLTREKNKCSFILNEENEKSTRFYFNVVPWGNKAILKEVKTVKKNREMFGETSTLSQYQISETGDTYLSMHKDRMIRILNEISDTGIIINYTPKIDPAEPDTEKRKRLKAEARERAYAIANYLLNTNKS